MGVYKNLGTKSMIEVIATSSEDIANNVWQQVMNLNVDFKTSEDFTYDSQNSSVICNFSGFIKIYGRVIYNSIVLYSVVVGNFGCMFRKNGVTIGDSLSHFRFTTTSSTRILSVPSLTSITRVNQGDVITMHANHEEGAGVLVPTFFQANSERTGFYVERM